MSEPEKTHIVVILLAVFGGFVFLGCIVFAGLSFFMVGGSSDTSLAPIPQVTVTPTTSPRPLPSMVIRSLVTQDDGRYILTVSDSLGQLQGMASYELNSISSDNPNVTIELIPRDPKAPLSKDIPSVLKLTAKNGATVFTLKCTRHIVGPGMDQSFPAVLKIDLQKSKAAPTQKKESLEGVKSKNE